MLGNHEVMNLLGRPARRHAGDLRGLRRRRLRQDPRARLERVQGADEPPGPAPGPNETPAAYTRTQDTWLKAYAPGCIEYRQALGPRGVYGRWLRGRPIAVQVGDSVFMHAGPPTRSSVASVAELNTKARQEIERFDRFLQRLVDAGWPGRGSASRTRWRWPPPRCAGRRRSSTDAKAKGETPNLEGIDVDAGARRPATILQIGSWSLLAGEGPLWYRGYANAIDEALQGRSQRCSAGGRRSRLVVGHTVQPRLPHPRPFRVACS